MHEPCNESLVALGVASGLTILVKVQSKTFWVSFLGCKLRQINNALVETNCN